MADGGAALEFTQCNYTVMTKKKGEQGKTPRKLITDVSASIPSGVVMAVMGPSGAGKTTLLSMIMLDRVGGKGEGVVKLGGHDFNLELYNKHCAVVTQYDCLWWCMTPREHIASALDFYQPDLQGADKTKYMDSLIESMGLTSAQNTKAGNAFVKGLSGGQKRRASLAVALCKKPLVIFLDEPTSGLDAAAAASIMSFLKKVAVDEKIAIFCTIHSPSTAVFNGFDQVLFLTGGKTAYIGTGAHVADYVASVGEPLPPNTNPADWMLDLINKDFSPPEKVDELVGKWAEQAPSVTPMSPMELPEKKRAGFCGQVAALLKKHGRLVIKDPSLYLGRMVAFPCATTFFAIVYIDARNRKQEQAQPKMFLGMWCIAVPGMLALVACFSLNQEMVAVRREIKDGMYSALSYVIATSALQVPLITFISMLTVFPTVYPMIDLPWDDFHVAWLSVAGVMIVFEQCAQFLSLFKNPLLGMMGFMGCWFIFFLFVGVLFRAEDVIWPFRAFDYFSPVRLGVPPLVWAWINKSPEWEGAEFCSTDSTGIYDVVAGCVIPPGLDGPDGFYCPEDTSGNNCFGKTGEQVLRTLGLRFDSLTHEDTFAEGLGRNLGLAALIKLCYFGVLSYQLRQIDLPAAPGSLPAPPATPVAVKPKVEEEDEAKKSMPKDKSRPHGMETTSGSCHGSPAVGAGFIFKNCTYTVMVKKKGEKGKVPRVLIDNVSGEVPAGSVLAIMGPSGAGKTTLLSMLMMDKIGGVPEGTVLLGGQDFTLDVYKEHACVVQQTDLLWWALTPRDHIWLAVQLYQPKMETTEQAALVESLIKNTGLSSAQNTKAGNIFFKGLSGGQKRRLSLAIALAKRPHVVFLDEPTSGLDAAAAASVMHYLKDVAHAERLSILCTIHQPSTAVFNGFDKVLFLTGGKTAYIGPADQLCDFLARAGKPVASNANPADYMLDLINKDFGDSATMEAVVAAWRAEEPAVVVPAKVEIEPKALPTVGQQTSILFKKAARLLALDPIAYAARAVMFMSSTIFFCVIYIKARNTEQEQVINRLWVSMWYLGVTTSLGVIVIYIMGNDYLIVKREVKDGMYHPLVYVLSATMLQLPMVALMCLCIVFPAFYPIGAWKIEQFYRSFVTCFLSILSFDNMAEVLSVLFANPLIGMLMYLNFWFACFLFCGVLVAEDSVPWPFRALTYVSPLRWAFNQLAWSALIDETYPGTVPCTPSGEGILGISDEDGSTVNCPRGFYCPEDPTGVNCWGGTGEEILTGLSSIYSAISPGNEDDIAMNLGILAAITSAFKVCYLFLFVKKSKNAEMPKKPSSTSTKAAEPSATADA